MLLGLEELRDRSLADRKKEKGGYRYLNVFTHVRWLTSWFFRSKAKTCTLEGFSDLPRGLLWQEPITFLVSVWIIQSPAMSKSSPFEGGGGNRKEKPKPQSISGHHIRASIPPEWGVCFFVCFMCVCVFVCMHACACICVCVFTFNKIWVQRDLTFLPFYSLNGWRKRIHSCNCRGHRPNCVSLAMNKHWKKTERLICCKLKRANQWASSQFYHIWLFKK